MNWDTGTMANIGWQSEQAAYRFYYGQIEAFGKKSNGNEPDRLILAGLGTLKTSYHKMQDWGMDVLHIGNASGLGGLSVWEDGNRLPLIQPGGKGDLKIERKILARGPVRSLVRVEYTGLKGKLGEYRARLDMSAYAGNPYSRQEVTVWRPRGKGRRLRSRAPEAGRRRVVPSERGRRAGQLGQTATKAPATSDWGSCTVPRKYAGFSRGRALLLR